MIDTIYNLAYANACPPGYPYRPLQPFQFRLLEVLPGIDYFQPVVCTLHHAGPASYRPYAALSYVWGPRDPTGCTSIELDSQRFEVTPNLLSALKELRHPGHSITLWVDAISINQSDLDERNHQVTLMRSIYEGAKFVFMWLGEADEDSDTAMRFLVDFNDDLDAEKPSQLEKMLNGIATSREALRNLFVREYWKRVWIMQEVIVSKNAYVCCGKFIAKWTSVALFLLAMPEHRLHQETLYDFMSVRRAADAYVIPLAKLFLKRFAQVEISPYEGLQLSRQRYATELHDYVFAVLGFTKPFPITVDYGIPVPELVVDLVEKFIERDRNLDILTLCKDFDPEQYDNDQGAIETEARRMLREFKESLKRPNHSCRTMLVFTANQFIRHYEKELTIATGQSRYQDQRREQRYQKRQQENSGKEKAKDRLEEELEHRQRGEEVENDEELDAREAKSFWSEVGLFALPSWVPRWHDRAVSEEKYISFKRFRLGTLRASKDVSASVEFRRSDLGLSIKGILIDAVTYSIEPSHMMASLSDEEKETILPWSDNVVEMGYKSFVDEWKTWSDAYAEQKSSQYGDLEGQRNAYRELVFLDPEWEQGDQQNLISRVINAALKWTDESMMDIQTGGPYLKSLPQLPSYFHHFVTKSGYMGRGPKTTNKGDLVCILYGASVPFVLREFEEKYYLLGECYVPGLMQGEAIDNKDNQEFKETTFALI